MSFATHTSIPPGRVRSSCWSSLRLLIPPQMQTSPLYCTITSKALDLRCPDIMHSSVIHHVLAMASAPTGSRTLIAGLEDLPANSVARGIMVRAVRSEEAKEYRKNCSHQAPRSGVEPVCAPYALSGIAGCCISVYYGRNMRRDDRMKEPIILQHPAVPWVGIEPDLSSVYKTPFRNQQNSRV